jgi:hypothetical protein
VFVTEADIEGVTDRLSLGEVEGVSETVMLSLEVKDEETDALDFVGETEELSVGEGVIEGVGLRVNPKGLKLNWQSKSSDGYRKTESEELVTPASKNFPISPLF